MLGLKIKFGCLGLKMKTENITFWFKWSQRMLVLKQILFLIFNYMLLY